MNASGYDNRVNSPFNSDQLAICAMGVRNIELFFGAPSCSTPARLGMQETGLRVQSSAGPQKEISLASVNSTNGARVRISSFAVVPSPKSRRFAVVDDHTSYAVTNGIQHAGTDCMSGPTFEKLCIEDRFRINPPVRMFLCPLFNFIQLVVKFKIDSLGKNITFIIYKASNRIHYVSPRICLCSTVVDGVSYFIFHLFVL